jgi:hypothetical protein
VAQDADEPETAERGPEDLARLVEALHPTKEEDERAERFAARLLERPAIAEGGISSAARVDPEHDRLVAEVAEAKRRSWQRDVLMAAVGLVLGIVGTLIVVAIT